MREPLTILTDAGPRVFEVEVADTGAERARGLMYRETLAADAGMLFDFERPRRVSMWMKNTLIPLDMLFIDDAGKVVEIAANTVPHDLTAIGPDAPVRAVLELNGGASAVHGIEAGDRVCHAMFGDAGEGCG